MEWGFIQRILRVWADHKAEHVITLRKRFTVAEVNAGADLVVSPGPGMRIRPVDMSAIAVGGAATVATDVRILGTRAAVSVALLIAAIAGLTQNTLLRAGAANATILAGGESFTELDADTKVTVGKTGGTLAGATHIDVIFNYTLVTQ